MQYYLENPRESTLNYQNQGNSPLSLVVKNKYKELVASYICATFKKKERK